MPTLSTIAAVAALTLGAVNAEASKADCKTCVTAWDELLAGDSAKFDKLSENEIEECLTKLQGDQCDAEINAMDNAFSANLDDTKKAMLDARDAAVKKHPCRKCAHATWGPEAVKECPDLIKQNKCAKEIRAKFTSAFEVMGGSTSYVFPIPTPTPPIEKRGEPNHDQCVRCTYDNWSEKEREKCPPIIARGQCQKEFLAEYGFYPYDNNNDFIWQPPPPSADDTDKRDTNKVAKDKGKDKGISCPKADEKQCEKCAGDDKWEGKLKNECPMLVIMGKCQDKFDYMRGPGAFEKLHKEYMARLGMTDDDGTNRRDLTIVNEDDGMTVAVDGPMGFTIGGDAPEATADIESIVKRNVAADAATTGYVTQPAYKTTSAARYGQPSYGTVTEKVWVTETVKKTECPTITTSCTHWTVTPSSSERSHSNSVTIPIYVHSDKESSSTSSKHAGYPTVPAVYPVPSKSVSTSMKESPTTSSSAHSAPTYPGPSEPSKTSAKQTYPASSSSSESSKTTLVLTYPGGGKSSESSATRHAPTQPKYYVDTKSTQSASTYAHPGPSTSASRWNGNSTSPAYSKGSSTHASQSYKATTSGTKVYPGPTESVVSGASKTGLAMGALAAALAAMTLI